MEVSFNFGEDFFLEEKRGGFKVSSLMKRCWAAGMQTIADMSKVCERHNIQWFAFCGTLLGGVRHHGFIPWDDDVDIAMKRADYMRFLQYAPYELPSFYTVETYDEYDYNDMQNYVADYDGITRINTSRLPDFNPEHMNYFHGFPYPSGIDLYPLDYISDNPEEDSIMKELHKLLNYIRLKIKEKADENHNLDFLRWENIEEDVKEKVYEIEELLGQEMDKNGDILIQLDMLLDAVSSMFAGTGSDRLAFLRHYIYKDGNFVFREKWFEKQVKIPFESGVIYAPDGFDEVLKVNYGANYMIPSTVSVHEYPYYKKWEARVKEYAESNPEISEIMSAYYYPDIEDRGLNGQRAI